RRHQAIHLRSRDRAARQHASAGDEDAWGNAHREPGGGVRVAVRHAVRGDSGSHDAGGGVPGAEWARVEERMTSRILILDYGSQFTQLIARRVREARVYSEIHPPTRTVEWVREWQPNGIILSGGPSSVYDADAPTADPALLDVAPVLGLCYGMQLVAHLQGGAVVGAGRREYGRADVEIVEPCGLFEGFAEHERMTVWMSHGDHVDAPPPGYVVTASSTSVPIAAIRHREKPISAVQFHPEVAH